MGNRVLILGGSGFIGNALYKELQPYLDVYATYYSADHFLQENCVFHCYDIHKDDINSILNLVKPNVIISTLNGGFDALYTLHERLFDYISVTPQCNIIFLSSVMVFDGIKEYPSFEDDKPFPQSNYGKYACSVEKLLQQLPEERYCIARLPIVLGVNAPLILQLKESARTESAFELYPNLVINATTVTKLSQQIHYIINQKKHGIYHLGSTDLIHHSDLFEEIATKLGLKKPVFKHVYDANFDRYLAVLSRGNKLPSHHRISISEVIAEVTLNENCNTLKETLL